jgi:tetratricopeptide (TPR) repeat protein
LNQEIFSLKRPNSRLTKEYQALTKTITKYNLGDRSAVLELLNRGAVSLENITEDLPGPGKLEDQLDEIELRFPIDGEVLFNLAVLKQNIGKREDAIALLTSSPVDKNFRTSAMFYKRAKLFAELGQNESACQDLNFFLSTAGANVDSFLEVIRYIDRLCPKLIEHLPESMAFTTLSYNDRFLIARVGLDRNIDQVNASYRILNELRNTDDEQTLLPKEIFNGPISLNAIALGKYDDALEILNPKHKQASEIEQITDAFNIAMALWGRDRRPQENFFRRVAELEKSHPNVDANFLQCMAITYGSLGEREKALTLVSEARLKANAVRTQTFSAWRYMYATPKEFALDLDDIEALLSGQINLPLFMRA